MMIKIQIKSYFGSVLFEAEKEDYTLKRALRDAVLRDADLSGANLRGANLRGAVFFQTKFFGKGGKTKIKKSQVDNFFKALGVIVED